MSALSSRVTMLHRCTILRNAGAGNSWGGKDASWSTLASAVPCKAWFVSEAPIMSPSEVVPIGSWRVALTADTDITVDDRIGPITLHGSTILPGPAYRIDSLVRWGDWVEVILRATG